VPAPPPENAVLSIRGKTAADGSYYTATAAEYYNPSRPGEAPGEWADTKAARALNLLGDVRKSVFERLCDGFAPDGTKLRQNAGKENAQAFTDMTVSDPKGLSIFELLADDATRAVIQQCRDQAIQAMLEMVESRAVARVGKCGRGGTIDGSIVVAKFRHMTSRALDVQSHTHLVFFSQILSSDGKWRAVDWKRTLYERGVKKMLGAVYRTEMSRLLQSRLGLEITRLMGVDGKQTSLYDLKEMQERFAPLLAELSKRREQVLERLAAKGEDYSAEQAAKAVLESRPAKNGHISEQDLRSQTLFAARAHGFFPEIVARMLGAGPAKAPNADRIYKAILSDALADLKSTQAHFSRVEIEKAVFDAAVGRGLAVDVIRQKLKATLDNPKGPFVGLGHDRFGRFTTAETLKTEAQLFADLDTLHKQQKHSCNPTRVQRVVRENPQLTREQVEALQRLTSSSGLVSVDGYAGTGKSRVLKAALACWKGYSVIGCAVSGKAAEGLQESSGITSYTLARLIGSKELNFQGDLQKGIVHDLKHHARMLTRAARKRTTWKNDRIRLGPNSIVVVDEAGMVGTEDLRKLAQACAKAKAKLVLVGDADQLGPLSAGAPFREVCRRFGVATLTTIVRQTELWHQRAVKLLSKGRSDRALQEFARRGLLDISPNRRRAIDALVADFAATGGLRDTRDRVALAVRTADVEQINSKIQHARKREGVLGRPTIVDGRLLFENDRVVFRKNCRVLGVKNGTFGVIESLDERERVVTVRLDNGRTVRVDLQKYSSVFPGYCSSNFRAQGITQTNVFVFADGLDRQGGYVALSRARATTKIFLSEEAAGENLAQFTRALKTDNAKTLATSELRNEQSPRLELRLELKS
jgi:conjugative relaxase-like TrwC/TraI family protein